MYKTITIEELLKTRDALIIDVREPNEFELGNIPNSINIPAGILLDNCEKYLKPNVRYYLYCETSLRSSRACEFLSDMGYDVYLIEGGYKGFLAQTKQN
ncbi:MAG: rhodanese-like domain-containing protein [Bacilli bacterium]|jgi:rhodanese-related sulfurtransferase